MQENRYLRKPAAEFLTRLGLPITAPTLAKMAVHGTGPAYQKWGRHPVYLESELCAWVEQRLGKPATSTTEHQANRAA